MMVILQKKFHRLAEDFIPAPLFLLERAMAEIFQFLPDHLPSRPQPAPRACG